MSSSKKPKFSRTTPFPNQLIDDVMPRLNDTQWRVLCVIVRQTMGWYDRHTGSRKVRDWLTQSQLKARTGRNAQALAAAIDLLGKQGYIVVEDESGNPLHSPQNRRAYRGRCYYRLADAWLRRVGLPVSGLSDNNLKQAAGVAFQTQTPKTEFDGSGKSNRTKEKQTKDTESAAPQLPLSTGRSDELPSAQTQEFIALFAKASQEYWGTTADTALTPQQLASLKRLLETHAGMDWTPHLQAFFRSDFQYVKQHGYALSAFVNTANVLLLMKQASSSTADLPSASSRNA